MESAFGSCRLAAPWPPLRTSLIAVVVAEMLAGHDGLGFLLVRKAFAIRIPEVYALMFVCAANGLVLNAIVNAARWQLAGWHLRMTGQPA